MSLFLTHEEVRELTGFALKSKQIDQLRRMGIAFFVNGSGRPIVTVSVIEGNKREAPKQQAWRPTVLQSSGKAA